MQQRRAELQHCPQCQALLQQGQQSKPFCRRCHFPIQPLANKYRLQKILAEGSSARIYLAHHTGLLEDRERVIKVIRREHLDKEESRIRFAREIQVTIALSKRNEHIVGIYDDFGEDPFLGHYYVMEYLQGQTLQQIMYEGEPLEHWLAFHIFYQLCKGMGAAHRAGVVHRDLKPENILLVERDMEPNFVKIIDFGIAKPLKRKVNFNLTQGALGTPAYMSPEQCVNEPVDGRSDIYSMGVLLYEMLTGHTPFGSLNNSDEPPSRQRENMLEILKAHIKNEPTPMRELRPDLPIAPGLDQVVLRTLAKDPNNRYQTVEDFWNEVAEFAPPEYQRLALSSQNALPSVQLPTSQPSLPSYTEPEPEKDWSNIPVATSQKPREAESLPVVQGQLRPIQRQRPKAPTPKTDWWKPPVDPNK
ncbi:MAG: serine/threonine protein kinase [Deltaproteobacteria bacterium]|nr:MAG: serine/threonine protein kinase [Deltaproteobacteria bacterium]